MNKFFTKKQLICLAITLFAMVSLQAQTTLYANNFDSFTAADNITLSPEWQAVDNATAMFVDGALQLYGKGAFGGTIILNQTLPQRYQVEYDLTPLKLVNTSDMGRWTSCLINRQSNGDFYNAAIRMNGKVGLDKFNKNNPPATNSTWGPTKAFNGLGSNLTWNTAYRIKITVDNRVLTYYVNGTQIGSITMAEGFETGQIGFGAHHVKVRIDNLKVTTIPEGSEAPTTIYENNFDGYSPSDWAVRMGTTQAISYVDGAMELQSNRMGLMTYTGTPLPDNFQAEFDFSFIQSANQTRWGSFLFRCDDTKGFWHTAIRKNGNANIDNHALLESNLWPSINSFPRSTPLEYNRMYHIKVMLVGMKVLYYVDDEYVGTMNLPAGYETGTFGFAWDNSTVRIDNFKITTIDELPEEYLAELAIPTTAIANPPVVVAPLNTVAAYNALENSIRPSVVIINLDDDLNILADDNSVIASLNDFFTAKARKAVPAFVLKNATQVDNLSNFLRPRLVTDALLLVESNQAELLKTARQQLPSLRGIIRFGSEMNTQEQANAVVETLNRHYANVALLPITTPRNLIANMQLRLANVWLTADDTEAVYSAITKGANGVLRTDYAAVHDIYGQFTTPALIRKPFVSGHRGIPSQYPENTLEGFKRAFNTGADAFELDVYLTQDNHIVVIHDVMVDRTTNGTGQVESMTLQQLKELVIDEQPGISEVIPTLDEVFTFFKGKNVFLQLEVKSTKPALMTKLAELVQQHDFYNQLGIFSSVSAQLQLAKDLLPQVPTAHFYESAIDTDADYLRIIKNASSHNHQPDVAGGNVSDVDKYTYTMAARGLASWMHTINQQPLFDELTVNKGITTILTDYPQWGAFVHNLTANLQSAKAGEAFSPQGAVDGVSGTVPCGMMKIGGDIDFTQQSTSYLFTQPGTLKVLYYYDVTLPREDSSITYRLYSEPVTLTVQPGATSSYELLNHSGTTILGRQKEIFIHSEPLESNVQVEIFSMLGSKVYGMTLQQTPVTIDLPGGFYLVKVTNGNQLLNKKVFVH